jgi:hypothetical protein
VNRATPTGQPATVNCQSCGRFIGPALACPFCGAAAEGRLALRLLRGAAALLGIGGLLALYLFVRGQAVPLTRIAAITPMMNFGRVRVEGVVNRRPFNGHLSAQNAHLAFPVHDGSGEITVAAYGPVAQALALGDQAPQKGDRVSVAGTLNVAASGKTRLIVNTPEELCVTGAAAAPP